MRPAVPMITPALLLLALLSADPSTTATSLDPWPVPAASPEWLAPDEAATEFLPGEAMEEDLEEDGEDEALASGPWCTIEEPRPPALHDHSHPSQPNPSTRGRNRLLRAPPAN